MAVDIFFACPQSMNPLFLISSELNCCKAIFFTTSLHYTGTSYLYHFLEIERPDRPELNFPDILEV